MARRSNWRLVKMHRNYTVDQVARLLGVAKVTVRRWLKTGALPDVSDCKPALIRGLDLIAFLKGRRPLRQRCRPDQLYCLRCRAPREAAFRDVEVRPLNATGGNMRALCATCATVTHKRVRLASLGSLRGEWGLTVTLVDRDIVEPA